MQKDKDSSNHYFTTQPKSKMKLGLIRTCLRGRSFQFFTASGVFSKKRVDPGTRLLIESMILPEQGYILDIGCGYGAVGIVAASLNPSSNVIMIDINRRAIWLTKKNIKANQIGNAEARRGSLYKPVKGLIFNCILSNPPVSAGMETVRSIITEAPRYMARDAHFQIVVRSKIGETLENLLEQTFNNAEILTRKGGYRIFISEKQEGTSEQIGLKN